MALKIRTYQLGSNRKRGEGLRIGVVRRPPRGVHKEDYAQLNYYDVWFPILAPSQRLLSWIHDNDSVDPAIWRTFTKRYQSEMLNNTNSLQAVKLLAELVKHTPISIGCHCSDETRCHRSILLELIKTAAQ
jgi:uncharacterized protein YeaO (DUF488 family)